jgi:hypothetical protein
LAEKTVKNYVANPLATLGMKGRTQAYPATGSELAPLLAPGDAPFGQGSLEPGGLVFGPVEAARVRLETDDLGQAEQGHVVADLQRPGGRHRVGVDVRHALFELAPPAPCPGDGIQLVPVLSMGS